MQNRAHVVGLLPKWAGWSMTTPHIGFLHSILRFLGEKISPSFTMAISGEAFKMFVTTPPEQVCGVIEAENFVGTALAAMGYGYEIIECNSAEEIIPALEPFMTLGMPVLAWHVGDVPEWGALVGYHKSRDTVITQGILTPHGEVDEQKAENLIWEDKGCTLVGIKGKTALPDMIMLAREAIVRAVSIYERGDATIYDTVSRRDAGPFATGIDGCDALIGWLTSASEEELAAHCEWDFPYLPLVLSSCRKAANVFFKEITFRFGTASERSLRSIARHYARISELLTGLKDIFPFPGIPEDILDTGNRMKAAEALSQVAMIERRALAEMKSFLRQ